MGTQDTEALRWHKSEGIRSFVERRRANFVER